MNGQLDWIASPVVAPLGGTVGVPGDKSVSHRAIMLAALANGPSRITGFLEGEDTRATARIFGRMGVRIDAPSPGVRIVRGVGLHGLRVPEGVFDCGNSGTAMRLLCGVLAGQTFDSTLTGDASLSKRPMRRVIEPLARMGAGIEAGKGDTPPLHVHGGRPLHGIDYALPIASAQVKSALLLAGLYADGETVVTEPRPTRDYTERMLRAFGWPVAFEPGRARLSGGHALHATDIEVPADFSSAGTPFRRTCAACDRYRSARGLFLGGVLHRRRDHRAGFEACLAQRRHQSAPHGNVACAAHDGRGHRGRKPA